MGGRGGGKQPGRRSTHRDARLQGAVHGAARNRRPRGRRNTGPVGPPSLDQQRDARGGTAVLKAGATGAAAGAVLTVATEAAAGTVRVMNCPPGQEARCGAVAVAANAAPQVAIATIAGAAIGGLTKAGALTGATLSAPVVGTLVVAAAVGCLIYTGIRVWREMTPEQKARITGTMAASWARTKGWSSDTITALHFW